MKDAGLGFRVEGPSGILKSPTKPTVLLKWGHIGVQGLAAIKALVFADSLCLLVFEYCS